MKNIISGFASGAQEFGRNPVGFMQRNGSSVAGAWWLIGGIAQMVMGGIALEAREIGAAAANVSSTLFYLFSARIDRNVKLGATFGELGTYLTVKQGLDSGNPAVLAGFGVFTLTACINFGSRELTHWFGDSSNAIVRHTLGNPRRAGIVTMGSRMPILAESLAHQRWEVFAPFAIWLLGDISMTMSRATTKPQPPKTAQPVL